MVRFIFSYVDKNGVRHHSTASYSFTTGIFECASDYMPKLKQ